MKIAVLGTGYVGLVSGVCLASKDHSVTCFDVNDAGVCDADDEDTSMENNVSID